MFTVVQTIGVGVGGGVRISASAIVNTKFNEALAPSPSVAVIVTGKVPNSVGVPDISPVVLLSDTPAGKAPAVIAKVVGDLPPSVETSTESTLPSTAGKFVFRVEIASTSGEFVFKVEIESTAVTGPIALDVAEIEPPALVAVTLANK